MPTIETRNPLPSANIGRHLLRGQAPCTRRFARSPQSRGVLAAPSTGTADVRCFFDRSAATGSPEQHGDPQRLLEYRLGLVRDLAAVRRCDVVLDLGCGHGHHLLGLAPGIARGIGIDLSPGMIALARARLRNSRCTSKLTFAVDDAEVLSTVADRSIDLAMCIGAFEHMLDKRAVLASVYRVLKPGGRFLCLTLHADYVWYRTIAPLLRYGTRHLSSDRLLTRDEFSALLDAAGFRRIRAAPWTFVPRGDMPAPAAALLAALDVVGRHARLDSLRGGLALCAWKAAP